MSTIITKDTTPETLEASDDSLQDVLITGYISYLKDFIESDRISYTLLKELYMLASNPGEYQFYDIYDKVPIDVELYNELADELPEMFI